MNMSERKKGIFTEWNMRAYLSSAAIWEESMTPLSSFDVGAEDADELLALPFRVPVDDDALEEELVEGGADEGPMDLEPGRFVVLLDHWL